NNIAGLELFAPGQPLSDRLVLIDPTDLEWPVALNLFDVGLDRLDQYSQLDRERLTNSILELYDFVLGSLLDAGMTQKQTVIFRYITRLLLHIPEATIHTLRELLEDGGFDRYRSHIEKLQGSARAFFENEFNGKEFSGTKRQVLRRLYGILENQTFERMFSHPKSKLDLFSEM
ncbi:MAG: ATP-binding protein, partial [Gammaproteobacteria bacterium]|nr:ATP-binding protein [Gammaproteobacteria bacterium]